MAFSQVAAVPTVPSGACCLKPGTNPEDRTRSTLSFLRSASGPDEVVRTYRSGPGVGQNTCAMHNGWLPGSTYAVEYHRRDFHGIINGSVLRIWTS